MNRTAIGLISLTFFPPIMSADARDYDGSAAMSPIIARLMDTYACGELNYLEQGSKFGERALEERTQEMAPMTRGLSESVCENHPNAIQAAFAFDKLLLLRRNGGVTHRSENDSSCETSLIKDVEDYESDVPRWAEALQLIYGGVDGTGTLEACGGGDGDVSNHPRVRLIEDWGALWEDACSGDEPNNRCQRLAYAFRSGDASKLTEVFKDIIGVRAFCNGEQHEDNDPIRTDCSVKFRNSNVRYCPEGTLGVVQAIDVPEGFSLKNRRECVTGQYRYLGSSRLESCPDGTTKYGGFLCLWPVDCEGNFGCVNPDRNVPVTAPARFDARVYNYRPMYGYGGPVRDSEMQSTDDSGNVLRRYSFSSLYFNGRCNGGRSGRNITEQIGCLVHETGCSLGFGGTAAAKPTTLSFFRDECQKERTVEPTVAKVNDIDPMEGEESTYPLFRPLLMSSLSMGLQDGVFDCESIQDINERALCSCMFKGHGLARGFFGRTFEIPVDFDAVLRDAGYTPIPGGPVIQSCGGLPLAE